jgi:hypothetical protein
LRANRRIPPRRGATGDRMVLRHTAITNAERQRPALQRPRPNPRSTRLVLN